MATEILVQGLHLVMNGISGDAGDRNGVASLVVPVLIPDVPTALTIDAREVANAIGLAGLRCTGRPLQQLECGDYVVNFHFEGLNAEVQFEQAEQQATYSFQGEMGDAPIQSHPNFEFIADKWDWLKDEEKFARDISSSKGKTSTGLQNSKSAKRPSNPLYGQESYLKAGATFSKTYAVTTVPPHVYQGVGTLIEYPPGAEVLNVPKFKRRVWLKMMPQIDTSSGSAIRITENFKLTGQDPVAARDIYGQGQLDE